MGEPGLEASVIGSSADEFAQALDELFSRFDEIADRHGLEKVKTIGDAYMAVAGAPVAMAGPAPRGRGPCRPSSVTYH